MDTESIYTIMGKTKNKMKQKTAWSSWAQLSLANATEFTHFRLPDVLRPAAPILGSYSLFVVFVAQPLVQLLLPNTFLREPPERGLQKKKSHWGLIFDFSHCQFFGLCFKHLHQVLVSCLSQLNEVWLNAVHALVDLTILSCLLLQVFLQPPPTVNDLTDARL